MKQKKQEQEHAMCKIRIQQVLLQRRNKTRLWQENGSKISVK